MGEPQELRARIDALYRAESRRVLATLIRLLGDFELAEEALSEAFAAALRRWPEEGVPAAPRAWLVAAGRFRALDTLRRRGRWDAACRQLAERLEAAEGAWVPATAPGLAALEGELADDRLRLIFTCCHPGLGAEARLAFTLREVCGLDTEEIARAFLTSASTIAQRIVRAKAKIRAEGWPFEVPGPSEWPARLGAVLQVLYLLFNEGHHATVGEPLVRTDLCAEAIRLGRLLLELLGEGAEPEAEGLLALMLLHHGRRAARLDAAGDLVTLEQQDRALWDRAALAEGAALVERALRSGRFGAYTLQAAIAALHAEAESNAATDWPQIVGLYDLLLRAEASPVVALNRAIAVGMAAGPAVGLQLVDELLAGGELADYLPAHAARADLCRRLGRRAEAADSYVRARDLASQVAERRYFERRLVELRENEGA
jgi:RNA polymerase sigma-70 factor (ECF subfamily)